MRRLSALFLAVCLTVMPAYALEVVDDVSGDPEVFDDPFAATTPADPVLDVIPDVSDPPISVEDDLLGSSASSEDVDSEPDILEDDGLDPDSGELGPAVADLYELLEGYFYPEVDAADGVVPYMDTSLVPAYGYTMAVQTSLGDATIYLPREASNGALVWSESGVLMNVTNSTINALLDVGGHTYQMRWQSFDSAEYYYSYMSGNYERWTWGHFVIDAVNDLKGVAILERDPVSAAPQDILPYLAILIGLVIICRLFTMR